MKPYVITSPALDALDLNSVKSHLKVDHVSEDFLITDLTAAAVASWIDDTGRVLMESTWEQAYHCWPCEYFEIDRYPVSSISSIKYTTSAGTEQTVNASLYTLYATPFRKPRVYLKYAQVWPTETLQTGPAIRIRFVAGNALPENIPEDIKAALKIRIGDLYTDRDGKAEMRSPNPQIGSDRVWAVTKNRHCIEV